MSNNIDPVQSITTIEEDDIVSSSIYFDIINQQNESDAIMQQLQTQAQTNFDEDAEDAIIQQAITQQILDQLNNLDQINQQSLN